MKLDAFNRLDAEAARAAVRPCVDIDRWVDAVVAGRPYTTSEELLETARTSAAPWTPAEIDGALAHHPRIGERAGGGGAEASLSRSEQAGIGIPSADVAAALAAGNRAYEEKFSRVFLIRAAGRTADEILDALGERLAHTEEEEIPVVAEQLRQIAVLRLEGIIDS
ncbi:2-oxo-4-hydroxy-4-carboxy-5-ureidoimidazoline decarboxylase [Microbacterium sp. NPDC056569]|uniref:2-oxo-4-hydroxy-4-carboxy-5-ureidoimidazoline decarboxylase n=1 Tax=Microbacterium sp. NPDC056569 TaxID=3345867 RepID=UPI00366D0055